MNRSWTRFFLKKIFWLIWVRDGWSIATILPTYQARALHPTYHPGTLTSRIGKLNIQNEAWKLFRSTICSTVSLCFQYGKIILQMIHEATSKSFQATNTCDRKPTTSNRWTIITRRSYCPTIMQYLNIHPTSNNLLRVKNIGILHNIGILMVHPYTTMKPSRLHQPTAPAFRIFGWRGMSARLWAVPPGTVTGWWT